MCGGGGEAVRLYVRATHQTGGEDTHSIRLEQAFIQAVDCMYRGLLDRCLGRYSIV